MQDFHTITITTPNSPAGKPAGLLKRLACSSIIGDNVLNSAGDSFGKIKDFRIDTREGKIEYVVRIRWISRS